MKRANLAVGALGAGLLLLAGCSALGVDFDLGLAGASAAGNVRVIDGSPETVAVTLQDSLKKRGLEATLLKDKDGIVVQSKTAAGLLFGLVLKSQRGPDGREQTHMSLTWMGDQDHAAGLQILAEIDRQSGVKK